jgi:putative membrane protein
MKYIFIVLAILVAVEHFYIMDLEMNRIQSERARRVFNLTPEFARNPKVQVMFKNQGLYNGFLAAMVVFGLIIFINNDYFGKMIVQFGLSCVAIAAIYGALTSSPRILIIQGAPAIMALLVSLFVIV